MTLANRYESARSALSANGTLTEVWVCDDGECFPKQHLAVSHAFDLSGNRSDVTYATSAIITKYDAIAAKTLSADVDTYVTAQSITDAGLLAYAAIKKAALDEAARVAAANTYIGSCSDATALNMLTHGENDSTVVAAITSRKNALKPVADFTADHTTRTTSQAAVFTDSSTNTPTSWHWDFGDGTTSTSQNPSKTYSVAGTYTVVLIATNAFGNSTKTRTGYMVIS